MRVACLLLAAGGGARFGGPKQLAPLAGKPLLRHALDALAPLFGADLHVVLGAHRERIEPLVGAPARIVEHPGWRDGLGSSIARGSGVIAARGGYDGVLIALGDQAAVTRRDYRRLLDRFDGQRVVAAVFAGATGAPALFPAALFDRLQALDGDRGAGPLLRRLAPDLVTVDVPRAARDVDTADDLERVFSAAPARRSPPRR